MINFRFHLASLVAVFLALALGVVIGSTVVDRAVVDNLNNRIDRVSRNARETRSENQRIKEDLERSEQAISALGPSALDDELLGRTVGVLATRGVDEDRVTDVVDAVKSAGATVTGILWLERAWHVSDDANARTLATITGDSTRRGAALREAAWRQLAIRLTAGPSGTRATDLLVALADAKLLSYDALGASDTSPARFGVRGMMSLFVVGDDSELPLKDTLTDAGNAFVAATQRPPLLLVADIHADSSKKARGQTLRPIRDSDLALTISTVDNLDRPEGPVAAALALADLDDGVVGHYGYGSGTKLVPERATGS